ncbi:hypothetical protein FRC00_005745, partial [Tulasnella sp. 408]
MTQSRPSAGIAPGRDPRVTSGTNQSAPRNQSHPTMLQGFYLEIARAATGEEAV